jgi:ABC-2 type transport system ATP-binding protein
MSLDVSDVVVRYGSRTAVDSVSLRVGRGITALLGPNGAGKSSLLSTISTTRRPTSGSVRLGPLDVNRRADLVAYRRQVGYLPQTLTFAPRLTVRETLEYAGWLQRMSASQVDPRVAELLDWVGLADRKDDSVRSLSGGMKRRLGLGQALVGSPQLLVLDEPTVGLDPEQRVGLRTLLHDLAPSTVVLVATHLVDDVAALAQHVTVLRGGQIVFDGGLSALVGDDAEPDARGVEAAYLQLIGASC